VCQYVDMWRTDVYKQLDTLEVNMADQSSTLSGAKRKLTLEGVTKQESSLFGEDNGESGYVEEFLGPAEGNTWPERWSIPGAYAERLPSEQSDCNTRFGRCGDPGDITSILERSARLLKSREIYGQRTSNHFIARRTVERIKTSIGKREILRSVGFFNGLGALFELYEKLSSRQESSKGPNMRIGATHSENETHTQGHVHIIHDCNTEGNADAASSRELDMYTMLKEQSTPVTSQSKTSSVSYISAKNGNLRTFSLTTDEQPYLLNLRCYKLSDIQGVPEREQWKKSYADKTLHFGHLSDVHQLVANLFTGATKEIMENGGSVWERKA